MSQNEREDEAMCKEADDFIKLYYDAMDRKREKISYLYADDLPTLIWNGNAVEGQDNIVKFIASLPETQHVMVSMDAQRIPDNLSGMGRCLVVLVAGSVTVGGTIHAYSQTFTLVVEDGKRKVRAF